MRNATPEDIQAAAKLNLSIDDFLKRKERWGNPDNFTFVAVNPDSPMTIEAYIDVFFELDDSLSGEEQEKILKERLDALGVTEEQQNQLANELLDLLAPRLTEEESKQMHKNWTPV